MKLLIDTKLLYYEIKLIIITNQLTIICFLISFPSTFHILLSYFLECANKIDDFLSLLAINLCKCVCIHLLSGNNFQERLNTLIHIHKICTAALKPHTHTHLLANEIFSHKQIIIFFRHQRSNNRRVMRISCAVDAILLVLLMLLLFLLLTKKNYFDTICLIRNFLA